MKLHAAWLLPNPAGTHRTHHTEPIHEVRQCVNRTDAVTRDDVMKSQDADSEWTHTENNGADTMVHAVRRGFVLPFAHSKYQWVTWRVSTGVHILLTRNCCRVACKGADKVYTGGQCADEVLLCLRPDDLLVNPSLHWHGTAVFIHLGFSFVLFDTSEFQFLTQMLPRQSLFTVSSPSCCFQMSLQTIRSIRDAVGLHAARPGAFLSRNNRCNAIRLAVRLDGRRSVHPLHLMLPQ